MTQLWGALGSRLCRDWIALLLVSLVVGACKVESGSTSDGATLEQAISDMAGSSSSSSSSSYSVNGDCRTSTTGGAVTITATNVTGLKYLDIPYKPTSSTTLTKVAVMLSSSSCSTFTTTAGTMYLYSDSGGSPNAILATGATINCSSLSSTATSTSFGFGSTALTGGTQYHIVFKFGGLTGGDTVTISEYYTSSSNCSGNSVGGIYYLNGTWQNQTSSNVGILQVN